VVPRAKRLERRLALSIILSSAIEASSIVIRDIESGSDLRAVEKVQKEVWACDDLDIVPYTLLVAGREVGATLIGAYDGASLVGFVYGFPGYEKGNLTHHSHMLAVKPSYRNFNLGYKLKLAQRERVLAQRIRRITWTFDPLQSLNAYFNFRKLGVIADTYRVNFYGEATSSFLHQIGTDRLWVTWLLDSQPVLARLRDPKNGTFETDAVPSLLQVGPNDVPQRNEIAGSWVAEHLLLEIPRDINAIQTKKAQLAREWREATRWAFTKAISSGYFIEDVYRSPKQSAAGAIYFLSKKKKKVRDQR
jgi:predicted GNAT superfamily acetyltransferase